MLSFGAPAGPVRPAGPELAERENFMKRMLAAATRREFMLTVEPLRVERGAGSPVNPIAVF